MVEGRLRSIAYHPLQTILTDWISSIDHEYATKVAHELSRKWSEKRSLFIMNIGPNAMSTSRQCAACALWYKPSAKEGQGTAQGASTYSCQIRILPN